MTTYEHLLNVLKYPDLTVDKTATIGLFKGQLVKVEESINVTCNECHFHTTCDTVRDLEYYNICQRIKFGIIKNIDD
jgi:hypothetical protein